MARTCEKGPVTQASGRADGAAGDSPEHGDRAVCRSLGHDQRMARCDSAQGTQCQEMVSGEFFSRSGER
ncbi:hypothetical protein SGM_5122 [Streptomyces griseoaurantiacus M045]|uniref:Uncharacterized protein n=1 Tax=Streptomyces griseoaurantiacus M045 TaxID=996637 RepID=F3NQ47_9ACTN|nr:hypothetical protein SGM_5122 [Streptomyces griseoaurantiacus M045]